MQLHHASDTTNAFPRETTTRLFCITLTYVTLTYVTLRAYVVVSEPEDDQDTKIIARFSGG